MRLSSVIRHITLLLVGFGCALMGGGPVDAGDVTSKPKRTIIESLDGRTGHVVAQADARAAAGPAKYDFSVTSEALPAIPGVVSLHAPDEHGWETIVEARTLSATAAPQAATSFLNSWIAALFVVAGSLILFWRRIPSFAGLKIVPRFAEENFSHLTDRVAGVLGGTLSKVADGWRRAAVKDGDKARAADSDVNSTDAVIDNGLDQVDFLFRQVDEIVAALREGSPLRDALQQELRLIQHRIGVTKSSASSADEPVDRVQGRCRILMRELDRVRRIADSAAASVRDPRDRLGIPQTPSEAYALLGVNPDVTEPVLKKLIDALRMTWHPDHARDESDRLLREERIKQINIAWDLIHSKH